MKYFGNTHKIEHARMHANTQPLPFCLLNEQERKGSSYDTEQLSAEVCCFET